jgi:serine/threonine-protein kinase
VSERYEFSDLDALFTRALDLPAEECLDLVTQVSQDSPELAAALSRLLERAERAEDFLGKRAESSRDTLLARSLASVHARDHAAGLQPGDFLGPYRIEETIGRGLRSVVYLAAREEADWTQKVAIKVLARGVNTDDVHRRFLAERQILTQLRYPGISILLDGGVTDDGLPYFVMEYIDGLPISDYCRKHRLDLDARISLFRQVCQAVAHAHRHLVVHRDIKPSNILVNQEGEAGRRPGLPPPPEDWQRYHTRYVTPRRFHDAFSR